MYNRDYINRKDLRKALKSTNNFSLIELLNLANLQYANSFYSSLQKITLDKLTNFWYTNSRSNPRSTAIGTRKLKEKRYLLHEY